MSTLNLTNPQNGQTTDANVIANNNDAIEAVVNGGIDNANISGSAAIAVSKLAAYPDDPATVLTGDGSWDAFSIPLAFTGVSVTRAADQSMAGATIVLFDTERFDTHAFHDTGTNTGRLTVPTGQAGYYLIGASVTIGAGGANQGGIRKNGTNYITYQTASVIELTSLQLLSVGDYVELIVSTDGTQTISKIADRSPEFWMYRIG